MYIKSKDRSRAERMGRHTVLNKKVKGTEWKEEFRGEERGKLNK